MNTEMKPKSQSARQQEPTRLARRILRLIERGVSLPNALAMVDSALALNELVAKVPGFLKLVDVAEAKCAGRMEAAVHKAALTEWQAARWLIERREAQAHCRNAQSGWKSGSGQPLTGRGGLRGYPGRN